MDGLHAHDGEARVRLLRSPRAAADARRFVEEQLALVGPSSRVIENAKLVGSELVTNAFRHGTGAIELRLSLGGDRLRLEVIDEGTGNAPSVREQPPDESGGWGLRIVERVSREWGVFEGTTHVWADLELECRGGETRCA